MEPWAEPERSLQTAAGEGLPLHRQGRLRSLLRPHGDAVQRGATVRLHPTQQTPQTSLPASGINVFFSFPHSRLQSKRQWSLNRSLLRIQTVIPLYQTGSIQIMEMFWLNHFLLNREASLSGPKGWWSLIKTKPHKYFTWLCFSWRTSLTSSTSQCDGNRFFFLTIQSLQVIETTHAHFLPQDRKQPDVCDKFFHDVPFEAHLASDIPELQSMMAMPGVDGFTMKVDALYKVCGARGR